MHKVFDISLRTANWRPGKAQNCKACSLRDLQNIFNDFYVDPGVAYHSFFADFFSAGFKLGFDQADHLSAGRQNGVGGWKYF